MERYRRITILNLYDDILEKIFERIKRPTERNAISAVCKRFNEIEARTRPHVLVYNMYAVQPIQVAKRFPNATSMTIKGNPRLVDFNILPRDWAGHAGPWIDIIKVHYRHLSRLRLKRMNITDSQIEDLCMGCGRNLTILMLDKCQGFSSRGLENIAKYCRNLTTLSLVQSTFDSDPTWLINMADACQSLESLDLSLIEIPDIDYKVLIKLASRCKVLKLWEGVQPDHMPAVINNCTSQLSELGIERLSGVSQNLMVKCTRLEGLAGIYDLSEGGMEAFLPIALRITKLDLSYASLAEAEITQAISACTNLQQLRVLDAIGDGGLRALGRSCSSLRRLVVENASADEGGIVTHVGLTAVARGCKNLQKLIFYASDMTSEALETLAGNCVQLLDVRICLVSVVAAGNMNYRERNLDKGVGILLRNCQYLQRLTLTLDVGLNYSYLTDHGLRLIGKYGKRLRFLTLANCGTSDEGLYAILNGCVKLQRLELRKSPFSDAGLAAIALNPNLHLKYLFVHGCQLMTLDGVRMLAKRARVTNSHFYVELIGCREARCIEEHRTSSPDSSSPENRACTSCPHWQVLAYHSLAEPRNDRPWFITRVDSNADHDSPSSGSGRRRQMEFDLNQPPNGGDDEGSSDFSEITSDSAPLHNMTLRLPSDIIFPTPRMHIVPPFMPYASMNFALGYGGPNLQDRMHI